jgi:streptogrisin C
MLAALLCASGLAATAGTAGADEPPMPPPQTQPSGEQGGPRPDVAYLMTTWGLTEQQALADISLQDRASVLAGRLADRQRGTYTGMRMDHATGTVTAYVTRAGTASAAADGLPLIESVVPRSRVALEALLAAATNRLASYPQSVRDGLAMTLDESRGEIALIVDDRTSAGPTRRTAAHDIAAAVGDGVVVRAASVAADSAGGCTRPYDCDPPMRGGVQIDNASNGTTCSAGFAVHSTVDNKQYVLTAAHCGSVGDTYTHRLTDGIPHTIGTVWTRQFSGNTDAEIIGYANVAGWAPTNWSLVMASTRCCDYNTSFNNSFQIIGYYGTNEVISGQVLCKTGSESSTTCGSVDSTNYTSTYNGVTLTDQLHTNGCMLHGDSGGGVYSYSTGKAAGLSNALPGGIIACNSPGQATTITKIDRAQVALHVQVNTGPIA